MEEHLQETADGSAKGLIRWYTLLHVRICPHCHMYLDRMKELRDRLRKTRDEEADDEAIRRLAAGAWRNQK
jgi:hypothetical protein